MGCGLVWRLRSHEVPAIATSGAIALSARRDWQSRSAAASNRGSTPHVNFCIKIRTHVAGYNINGIV